MSRHQAFERSVNITQWVCAYLGNPENEATVRSILGNGPKTPLMAMRDITIFAEQYGVLECEVGAALRALRV